MRKIQIILKNNKTNKLKSKRCKVIGKIKWMLYAENNKITKPKCIEINETKQKYVCLEMPIKEWKILKCTIGTILTKNWSFIRKWKYIQKCNVFAKTQKIKK